MYHFGYQPWEPSACRPPARPPAAAPAQRAHYFQEACSSTMTYRRQEIQVQRKPKKVVKRKTSAEKELDNMKKELAKKQRQEKKQLEITSKKLATVKKIEAKFKADKKTKAVAKLKKKKEPSYELLYEKLYIKKR